MIFQFYALVFIPVVDNYSGFNEKNFSLNVTHKREAKKPEMTESFSPSRILLSRTCGKFHSLNRQSVPNLTFKQTPADFSQCLPFFYS